MMPSPAGFRGRLPLFAGQGQLSKVERGKVAPTLEILLGLCDEVRESLDWIVKGDGS